MEEYPTINYLHLYTMYFNLRYQMKNFNPDQVLNSKFTILEHITNQNISGDW